MTVLRDQDVADHLGVQVADLPVNWQERLGTAESAVASYLGCPEGTLEEGTRKEKLVSVVPLYAIEIRYGPMKDTAALTKFTINGTDVDLVSVDTDLAVLPWTVEYVPGIPLVQVSSSDWDALRLNPSRGSMATVELEYTSGWPADSGALPEALKRAALTVYETIQDGPRVGVASETIGDHSISYSQGSADTEQALTEELRSLVGWWKRQTDTPGPNP